MVTSGFLKKFMAIIGFLWLPEAVHGFQKL